MLFSHYNDTNKYETETLRKCVIIHILVIVIFCNVCNGKKYTLKKIHITAETINRELIKISQ